MNERMSTCVILVTVESEWDIREIINIHIPAGREGRSPVGVFSSVNLKKGREAYSPRRNMSPWGVLTGRIMRDLSKWKGLKQRETKPSAAPSDHPLFGENQTGEGNVI